MWVGIKNKPFKKKNEGRGKGKRSKRGKMRERKVKKRMER